MTKDEAAQLIDQALSQLQTTREVHIKLAEALKILTDYEQNS